MITLLQAALCMIVASALSVGGMLMVRRSFGVSRLESHKEIAGFVYATIGVMYGVLMSFVCIAEWEQYSNARDVAQREATTVASLYHLAEGFDPPRRDLLEDLFRSYTTAVVNDEWPAMDKGGESAQAWSLSDRIWQTYVGMPDTERQRIEYQQSLSLMSNFYSLRSERLLANRQHVPPVIWWVLAGGAVITIGFTYLFGVVSVRAQAVMTVALTTSIVGILFLIYTLDTPFSGDVHVGPDSFQSLFGLFAAVHH